MTEIAARTAELLLEKGPAGPVVKAKVPVEISEAEFAKVATSAYALINRLTGCNCLSGRISFVVEDEFAEVIQVRLED
jgi:hypothetical protein